MDSFWRRCSTCKREMAFAAAYWTCSVSTCNRKGSSFVFCSLSCWNGHVPTMRHRDAWAEQQTSPSRDEWERERANAAKAAHARPAPTRDAGSESAEPDDDGAELAPGEIPHDVLIVASKLKKYIRARSGMNTSENVMDTLSDRVRALCEDAILRAREDGRKTVMDRDF
jgi:hypothetical protein